MKKSESASTLERDCQKFIKWETGQYDSLPRKSYQEAMEEWENQEYFDFDVLNLKNSAKARSKKPRKKKEKQNNNKVRQVKRKINERERKVYVAFYHEARQYENTDICRYTNPKRESLENHFPYQFIKKQPIRNYAPATLGSLFKNVLKYAKTITEETIAMAQAQQAQQ